MSSSSSVVQAATPVKARVAISRLMLTNFRSYGMLDLRVDASHVVLVGANGAGKTNVLEALSMLAPGRGLRGARLGELSRVPAGGPDSGVRGERPWAVSATIAALGGEQQLGVGYLPGSTEGGIPKRTARINGVSVSNVAHLAEYARLIWLSPSMDRLFVEGVSERRKFLDRLISSFDPSHAKRWTQFESAMRERIGALRSGGDRHWIRALERTMSEAAVALAASRLAGTSCLMTAMDCLHASIFPRADVGVSGWMEEALGGRAAIDIEDEYVERLERARDKDLESGRTSDGPHLTDFVVRHRERARLAAMCSTGEQKALLIRLVLGCASLQAPGAPDKPILLLDEIAAHLDEVRRRALFDEIDALNVQAWITGTDAIAFSSLDGRAQFKRVADGQIRPL